METRYIQIPRGAFVGSEQRPIYGYKTVRAKCLKGLAVHKANKGHRWKWMLTHEASGLCLEMLGAMTQKQALDNMRRATDIDFDWSAPRDSVIEGLKTRREVFDALRAIANHD